jgi:hypothetical protein
MSDMLRLSFAVPVIFALCSAITTAHASLPKSDGSVAMPKIERAERPALQQFARCMPGQEYRSAWIEEHWAQIPNVGWRVIDITYHGSGCADSNFR